MTMEDYANLDLSMLPDKYRSVFRLVALRLFHCENIRLTLARRDANELPTLLESWNYVRTQSYAASQALAEVRTQISRVSKGQEMLAPLYGDTAFVAAMEYGRQIMGALQQSADMAGLSSPGPVADLLPDERESVQQTYQNAANAVGKLKLPAISILLKLMQAEAITADE